MNRQQQLLNLYKNQKEKVTLVDGHGVMLNKVKKVPKKTALMFLAKEGACMNINTSIGIQNKFFTSKKNIENFLTSGRCNNKHYHHVTNILGRTLLPGNKYVNMEILLQPNKHYKTMGFMKYLPTKKSSEVPLFRNTVGPIIPKMYKLSKLLKKRKGIFIISACRNNPNNARAVLNVTKNFTIPRPPQSRGTFIGQLYRTLKQFKPLKGFRSNQRVGLQPEGNYKKKVDVQKYKNLFKQLRLRIYTGNKTTNIKNVLANYPANMSSVEPKLFKKLIENYQSRREKNIRTHRSGFTYGK